MTSVPLRKKFTNTLISRLFKRDPNQWPNHLRPGILLWACSLHSCSPLAHFGCVICSTSGVYKYSRAGFQFRVSIYG
ncbi:hypothetical protein B0H17DRAFT_1109192 [Mycena rosella]|uniref:Uncharacterized protein n=1 Tax=Mycena rosella TaxID=1033263 RepID=A0AAD7BT76_MYCRO|nr:hypothetical protein B0H17DRAFT_1109192 [Mycena rosella]